MPRTINDIFSSPAPAPTPVPSGSNPLSTLALVALVVVFGVLAFNRFSPGPGPKPDDQQGEKQEDKKQVEPSVIGKTLIFVHERNPQPIEHDLLIRDVEKWIVGRKLSHRVLDVDTPDDPVPKLVAFAKSKGIESPFVVLTNQSDEPVKVIKWPADMSGIEEFVK